MLRAAIYARYSSERQRATSVEDQIALCRDAAPRFDCTVLEDHIYADQEISGTIGQRPGYRCLLAAAKAHNFDVFLVESQDRLWRDQGEMHNALKHLRFWGVRVFSLATGTDLTDRTGNLMASVVGWKDEAFIEDLRDKTRRGLLGQIKRGFSAGGRAYGYRSERFYNDSGRAKGSQRVIDPDEAKVIRRIFELYAGGMSPKNIARLLNREHVPPPRASQGRRPLGWTWTTISGSPKKAAGILNNPLYAGRLVWNRSKWIRDPDTGRRVMRMRPQEEWVYAEAPQLGIVPPVLWEAVQKRRDEQRRSAKGNTTGRKPRYLFSGLLVCSECGQHYTIRTDGYYGCATNSNRGSEVCANGRLVRRDRLEETLLRLIYKEVFSPETVAYVSRKVNEALTRRAAPPNMARKRREAELAKARVELENIKSAIRQGIITPSTKEMLEAAERRVAELEAPLQTPAARGKISVLPSVVEMYLKDLKGSLGRDTDRARALLAKLIGRVTLRREGQRLVAELQGNLSSLLELDDQPLYKDGSGGWI